MEIPIEEKACKLRMDTTRSRRKTTQHITEVVYRWLKRGSNRVGKNTNRPSLHLETEWDPILQETYIFGSVDTFPDTAPDWLENEPIPYLHSVKLIEG